MTNSGDIEDAYAGKKLRTALGTEERNVKTTVAEYLVAGVLKSAEGFGSLRAAAEHHVDITVVAQAHGEASAEVPFSGSLSRQRRIRSPCRRPQNPGYGGGRG